MSLLFLHKPKIMKKLFIVLSLGLAIAACNSSGQEPQSPSVAEAPGKLTKVEWIDSAKNLGRINEGQQIQIAYKFKNVGEHPLVIQSVEPGCGCTVAEYPKQPIAPGAEGTITGAFDSRGRAGLQYKEILVRANTEPSTLHKLSFSVDVNPAKDNFQ